MLLSRDQNLNDAEAAAAEPSPVTCSSPWTWKTRARIAFITLLVRCIIEAAPGKPTLKHRISHVKGHRRVELLFSAQLLLSFTLINLNFSCSSSWSGRLSMSVHEPLKIIECRFPVNSR